MPSFPPVRSAITGVILAGGRSRRLGGQDKGLFPVAGRPLVAWAIESLAPQVATLLISANRHRARYADYGWPVVSDLEPDFQGPLAGFLSAMTVARSPWILTLPCDSPRPPSDLGARLAQALGDQNAELAVAVAGERRHSVHALLPVSLSSNLRAFLATGERRVERWYAQHRVALADFSDQPERFFNLNTSEEIRQQEPSFLPAIATASGQVTAVPPCGSIS